MKNGGEAAKKTRRTEGKCGRSNAKEAKRGKRRKNGINTREDDRPENEESISRPMSEENTTENAAEQTTFLGHLFILRKHLFRMALYVLIAAVVAFFCDHLIYDRVIFGPRHADFPTYRFFCWLSDTLNAWLGTSADLCMHPVEFNVQNRELTGQFNSHLWVSFVTGIIVAFPFIVWEVWRFVAPALTDREKRSARGVVFYVSSLFFLGLAFGYFVILPMSINFFTGYRLGTENAIVNNIELSSYISNVVNITLATGIMFQLPMAVYVLSRMGLITSQFLLKYYRHALVLILIVAAVLTPPDVVSQIVLAVPIVLLYQASITICRRMEKRRMRAREAEEGPDE